MKRIVTLLAVAVLLGGAAWAAGLKTVRSDGSSQLYELSSVQRIEFDQAGDNSSMRVTLKNGNPVDTDVKVVIFTEEGPNEVKELMGADVRYFLYPNPVQQTLVLTGPEAGETILVYDLAGRKVMSVKAQEQDHNICASFHTSSCRT